MVEEDNTPLSVTVTPCDAPLEWKLTLQELPEEASGEASGIDGRQCRRGRGRRRWGEGERWRRLNDMLRLARRRAQRCRAAAGMLGKGVWVGFN